MNLRKWNIIDDQIVITMTRAPRDKAEMDLINEAIHAFIRSLSETILSPNETVECIYAGDTSNELMVDPATTNDSDCANTARDALVISVPSAGFGNERAGVTIQNLAKAGWKLVPYDAKQHNSPGPQGYSPDEFDAPPSKDAEMLAMALEALRWIAMLDRYGHAIGWNSASATRARVAIAKIAAIAEGEK